MKSGFSVAFLIPPMSHRGPITFDPLRQKITSLERNKV